jgi:hypothetical protein
MSSNNRRTSQTPEFGLICGRVPGSTPCSSPLVPAGLETACPSLDSRRCGNLARQVDVTADTWIMDASVREYGAGSHEGTGRAIVACGGGCSEQRCSAMIDRVPRHLVSVLVMHDIRARLYRAPGGRVRLAHRTLASATAGAPVRQVRAPLLPTLRPRRDGIRRGRALGGIALSTAAVYELALPVDTSYFARRCRATNSPAALCSPDS